MVQPIRPNDATGIYRRTVGPTADEVGTVTGEPGATQGAGRRDQVTISDQAQALRRLIDEVKAQPETRDTLVADLRAQIASGEYQVDGEALAELLVDEGLR